MEYINFIFLCVQKKLCKCSIQCLLSRCEEQFLIKAINFLTTCLWRPNHRKPSIPQMKTFTCGSHYCHNYVVGIREKSLLAHDPQSTLWKWHEYYLTKIFLRVMYHHNFFEAINLPQYYDGWNEREHLTILYSLEIMVVGSPLEIS